MFPINRVRSEINEPLLVTLLGQIVSKMRSAYFPSNAVATFTWDGNYFHILVWNVCCTDYTVRFFVIFGAYKKVRQSHYKPEQALKVTGVWGSQISRQSAHEGGKVISPKHLPPLPPRKYPWYLFLLEAESTPGPRVRPGRLCQWKIPMTPLGIELATFMLVAQCLN